MKTKEEIEELAEEFLLKHQSGSKVYHVKIREAIEFTYTQCQEDIVNEVKKQISDFQHDLRECTSTYVKENCEGAIFGLNRLLQSLNKQC